MNIFGPQQTFSSQQYSVTSPTWQTLHFNIKSYAIFYIAVRNEIIIFNRRIHVSLRVVFSDIWIHTQVLFCMFQHIELPSNRLNAYLKCITGALRDAEHLI